MLNLDVSETLFSAIRREGAKVPCVVVANFDLIASLP